METKIQHIEYNTKLSEIALNEEIIDKLAEFNITTIHQLTKLTLPCLQKLKYFKQSELRQIRVCLNKNGYTLTAEEITDKQQQKLNFIIAVDNFLNLQSKANRKGQRNKTFWGKLKKIEIDALQDFKECHRNKLYFGGFRNFKDILTADYRDIICKCNYFGQATFILFVDAFKRYLKEEKILSP